MRSVVWTQRNVTFISTVHLQFHLEVCWSISSHVCSQVIKIPKHTHLKINVYVCIISGQTIICKWAAADSSVSKYANTDTVSQFMVQQFNFTLTGCRKFCGKFYNCRSRWARPCWDCGFEFWGENRCLLLVSVVCCQVEVSAKGRSLVQRSPTECMFVSECGPVQQQSSAHAMSRYKRSDK